MSTWKTLGGAIALLSLGACTGFGTPNTSNPDRFGLDASAVAHLRGPQTIRYANEYLGPAIHQLRFTTTSVTVDQDQQQYTETAIAMLSRALESQGIRRSFDAPKTIKMRVRIVGHRLGGVMISPQYTGSVLLEAELGNGDALSISASDMSPGGWARAFDAAILVALNKLVADEKFVSYVNN